MTREERQDEELRYIQYRQRYIATQLPAARRKVVALEREAKRYGMIELLSDPRHVNQAWDEAIDQSRAVNGYPDVVAGVGE